MGIRLKICGVTDLENLRAILGYCDYVGMIVDKNVPSPRRVGEDAAKKMLELCSQEGKQAVALVVSKEGVDTSQRLGFGIVQVHCMNNELIRYAVSRGLRIVPVFIASQREVSETELVKFLKLITPLCESIEFVLIDGDKSLPPLDSGLKLTISTYRMFVHLCRSLGLRAGVAGGVTPANVDLLLDLEPDVVDVSSGVESRPGIKDVEKVRALRMRLLEGR